MNITIAGSATNRKYDQDQIESISIELSAFDAECGATSLPIPDPAGTDAIVSGRNVLIVDGIIAGTPPTYTTFLDGFTISRARERGPSPAPPHRLAMLNVQDANALLYGMLVEHWVRPAETDVVRVLAAAAAFWPTLDTTWVLGEIAGTPPRNSPVGLPAKTYDTDAFVSEFVSDLSGATGKTLFVRSAGGTRWLHYHALTEGPAAAFSLDSTDGAADYGAIFPFVDPSIDTDGLELAYRVAARGPDGLAVTVTDTTSETAHGADGRSFEALIEYPDAADLTELTLLANQLLGHDKDERETITVKSVGPLTAAQAAGIGPGFIIVVTSDVLGLVAEPRRIAHLTWRYKHPGIWWADLELSMPLRASWTGRAKPVLGFLPCGPGSTPTGSYWPLGGVGGTPNPSTGLGLVIYTSPGVSYPEVPSPGYVGGWNFPTWDAGGPGTVDLAGSNVQNHLYCTVVGPGTITVHMVHDDRFVDASHEMIAQLKHHDGASAIVDSSQVGFVSTSFVFTVPDDGFCTHWVDVYEHVETGVHFGFAGFDWIRTLRGGEKAPLYVTTPAGGDVTGTLDDITVKAINGVVVSGAPSVGQTLIASGPAAASWQTPAPTGGGRTIAFFGG